MLRRVDLIRTDVSDEFSAPIIRVTKIGELRSVRRLLVTANVVPSSPILTLMMQALSSSETSVFLRSVRWLLVILLLGIPLYRIVYVLLSIIHTYFCHFAVSIVSGFGDVQRFSSDYDLRTHGVPRDNAIPWRN
jgi:hypothetical protein